MLRPSAASEFTFNALLVPVLIYSLAVSGKITKANTSITPSSQASCLTGNSAWSAA